MKIKQVSGAIGAIIEDVQLNENLDTNVFYEIYNAFLKYQVIFFRNQNFIKKVSYLLLKILEAQLAINLLKG